ncbi:MAG: SAM-dependent methyltransferase [Opitutaceae bacterium]
MLQRPSPYTPPFILDSNHSYTIDGQQMTETNPVLMEYIRKACADGPISYCDYINLALYSKDGGYYTRQRERVGRTSERDFYTAESLGPIFAKLVTAAAEDLLPEGLAAKSTFVEIAAEPGAELLSHLETHPFAASKVIRQGDAIDADGPVVIFANEWLDALPFHRLVFKDGVWRERGVSFDEAGQLTETLLDQLSAPVAAVQDRLPETIEEGYEVDLPLAAEAALADLIQQDWTGLILLFDYGKSWENMLEACPAGTARTFQRHQQGNHLLEEPGEKDITCDVCWDPLLKQLETAQFEPITFESQESFLVQRAQRAAEAIVSQTAGNFSQARQTLMELIHPAHMGRRFQVLWGLRKG